MRWPIAPPDDDCDLASVPHNDRHQRQEKASEVPLSAVRRMARLGLMFSIEERSRRRLVLS
jgi:hypothetical protein